MLSEQEFRVKSDQVLQDVRRTLLPLADEAGFEVDFIPFQGPHTIVASAMERLADLLEESADRDLQSANSIAN